MFVYIDNHLCLPQILLWQCGFLSYRNLSIGLLYNLIDWFPYEGNVYADVLSLTGNYHVKWDILQKQSFGGIL